MRQERSMWSCRFLTARSTSPRPSAFERVGLCRLRFRSQRCRRVPGRSRRRRGGHRRAAGVPSSCAGVVGAAPGKPEAPCPCYRVDLAMSDAPDLDLYRTSVESPAPLDRPPRPVGLWIAIALFACVCAGAVYLAFYWRPAPAPASRAATPATTAAELPPLGGKP